MKESQRTSRFVELKSYNIDRKGDDFLEVTEWSNGEGFDLHLSRDHQWMSMTWEELTAFHAALGDWIEQPADACPHIASTTDGSNYCSLRISHLRLANAVADLMPDRAKFFADLTPDSDD